MKTVRILELDGEGMRGLCSAYFLQRFVTQWGVNPATLYKIFNLITGTSIGGIQSMAYTVGQTPTQLIDFFMNYGPQIFQTTEPGKTGRATEDWKGRVLFLGGFDLTIDIVVSLTITFLSYDWDVVDYTVKSIDLTTPPNFYDNTILLEQLQSILGEDLRLGNIKTNMLVTSFEQALTKQPQLFSNASLKSFVGRNFKAWQCAAATGAAPYYFPYITLDGAPAGNKYIDGGIYLNNTTSMALSMASVLYPDADRVCLLSVGTGSKGGGFSDTISLSAGNWQDYVPSEEEIRSFISSWISDFIRQKLQEEGIDDSLLPSLPLFVMIRQDKSDPPQPTPDISYSFSFDIPGSFGALSVTGTVTVKNSGALIDYLKSRIQYLLSILDFAGQSQEAVAKEAELMAYYGQLPARNRFFYYRFQPKFPPGLDVELDNTSPEFMENMKIYANKTYDEDQFKIGAFIQNLSFGM